MGPFDSLLSLFGLGVNEDPQTTCGSQTDVCAAIQACGNDDPCAASWHATYQYYADRQFDMAQWQALLGVAMAVLQYTSADRTADLQYDIADRQMSIAEEEYCRYKSIYVPCEDALLAEVCAEMIPEVQYDVYADRALRDVNKQFDLLRQRLARTRSRYCMADNLRSHCELEKAQALTTIAARDAAYRYAESRRDYLEARRWERRTRMLGHGRDIFAGQSNAYNSGSGQAIQALQSGQNARNQIFSNLYGIGNSLINSYYNQFFSPTPFGVPGGQGGFSPATVPVSGVSPT